LGVAILSAGIKKLGFECRTFHWNVEFIRSFPAKSARRRVAMHHVLSYLFPLNEWVFAKHVFPESDDHDPRIAKRLAALDREKARLEGASPTSRRDDGPRPSEWIPQLRSASGESLDRMAAQLSSFDIVGISSTFFQNMAALALAKKIKATWPDKIVVLGGANCDDVMGVGQLTQFGFIDYAFSGEVDASFPEFVRRVAGGEEVKDVPGIIYRDEHGQVTKGPAAVPVEDMNGLPVPDYDDYIEARESSDVSYMPLNLTLESSRGCWWGAKHHCVFCGLNANGMAFRHKANERFQSELEEIVRRYRPKHLTMTDNIISNSYYGDFLDWARQRRLGLDFFYEIKANLNRKQVERLYEAGITRLQPGIESFSSPVLSLMDKGIRGIQNVAFLKYASDSGVSAFYNVLGGFAGEQPDEYSKMAQNARALVHLQPPAFGVVAAQYHRFSPMFRNPKAELRPLATYSELYPFSEETIATFAYFFEPRETRQYPYFEPLTKELVRWREHWAERGCTLTWAPDGDAILIRDRRPGFTRRNVRLTGHAVAVFHALDRPRKLQGVAQELSSTRKVQLTVIQADDASQERDAAPDGARRSMTTPQRLRAMTQRIADRWIPEDVVSFTSEEFDRNPDACLKGLVDGGIIYVEDDMHLTLPVSELHRPRQLDRSSDLSGAAFREWLGRRASAARALLGDLRKGELDRAVSTR
jgi:ribosomal peptide maturation radical SAM protein 1